MSSNTTKFKYSVTGVGNRHTNVQLPALKSHPAPCSPDGIVRNRKSGKWLLFDFTRGTTIQQVREGKIEYYAQLMQDLQVHEGVGRVVFYPMVSTFRCSIEEREWSKALVDSGPAGQCRLSNRQIVSDA